MGTVTSRAKVMEGEEVKDEYLREGWSEKTVIYLDEINEKEGWEAKNVRNLPSSNVWIKETNT